MSNLAEGIFERGFKEGLRQGIQRSKCEIVLNAYEEGLSISLIAKITGLSEEEVLQIIERVLGDEDWKVQEVI